MDTCPVFIDETGILSGAPRQQPVYGIGALVIPDTRSITDSFYRLHFNFIAGRRAERYRIRRDILSRAEPQFHAVMLDRLDPAYSLSQWNGDEWSAYAHLSRELLERHLDRDVFAIVDLQGKPDKSPEYMEDTLCSMEAVKGCLRATSDMSIYLQIVDVLLGCVQFDWKDTHGYYDATLQRAAEKRELVNLLKSRLGLRREMPLLESGEGFRQWEAPSTFTIWRREW